MAGIQIEKTGARVYFTGDTYAVKDRIKSMGGHWDGERRAWWVGAKLLPKAEALLAELCPAAALASSVGLRQDTPAAIVADALDDAGKPAEAEKARTVAPKPKEDPDNIRLTGKGRYKGREYYAGAITRDGTRVRLLTLPDADGSFLDFWADCAQVEEVKRYQPREVWDGRYNSGRTVTKYTTLGSIAAFVAREKRNRAEGGEVCAE
jgi:hypothetical protein